MNNEIVKNIIDVINESNKISALGKTQKAVNNLHDIIYDLCKNNNFEEINEAMKLMDLDLNQYSINVILSILSATYICFHKFSYRHILYTNAYKNFTNRGRDAKALLGGLSGDEPLPDFVTPIGEMLGVSVNNQAIEKNIKSIIFHKNIILFILTILAVVSFICFCILLFSKIKDTN